ncbi:MAG: phage tail length tape measure family protein [Paraburkholderia fungorum]|nr:phage tail length tape measure family protein [Paraburkholderia fungorum]
MAGTSGSLGQLVVQLTMDPSSYSANMRRSSSEASQFGSTIGKTSKQAAEGMDKIGAHTAASRRELVVMGHEVLMGNWRNLGGSAMVFAEQIDAMKLIMSPAGLAVTALTGVIAAFAVAIYKGHEAQETFNKSLQVTGNYAGLTSSSFAAMTRSIADATGDGLGAARQGLLGLVSSGQITGQALELLGQAVVRMHDLTGEKLDEIAKDYARMPEGVAKWAAEHNRSMHFITTAQYEYIQRLEETGDKQGAMLVVAKALDEHLRNESLQNLGALEKAWRGVGNAISGAWEWMKSIGRDETMAEKIAGANAEVQRLQHALQAPSGAMNADVLQPQLQAAQAKLEALNRDALREQERATTQATNAQTQQAGIDASDFLKKLHDQEKGISRVNQALDEYRRKVTDFNNANPGNPVSAQQQATDEASIRKQYTDKDGMSEANRLRKSLLDAALQQTKNSLDLIQSAYKNSDDQLQALHKATLISDQAFYTAEIALSDDAAQKQIAAYEQERKTLQAAYWKAPADERIRITKEIGEVDTKIVKVRQDNAAKDMVYLTQQTDAQRKYLKSITDTHDALLAQAGISMPKALHDFDERNRGAMLQAATTGDIGGAAFLDQSRQLTKLSAQYSDIIAQSKDAQTRISLDQQEGLTGLVDGFSQLRANSADTVSSLQQLYDEVNRLSWQTTDEGVLRNLDQLRSKIRQSMLDSSNYLKDFTDAGRDAFRGLFQDIAEGTKTPAQAVKSMVASMLGSLAQLFANKAYTSLLGTLFDGLSASAGGTGNSAYGFTMGSSIQGSGSLYGVGAGIFRAGGGLVSGPGTSTSDSILAHLSDGEYVVKASAVAQPGVLSLLESINSGGGGSRNRFALGGYVGAAPASASSAMPSLALSVPVTVDAGDGSDASPSSPRVKDLMSGLSEKIRAAVKDETRPGGIIYLFYKNGR